MSSSTPSPPPQGGGGRSQRARQVEAFDGACTQLFLIPIASVFHAGAGLEADLGALMPHGKRKLCETFYAKHPEYKYPSSNPTTPLDQKKGTPEVESTTSTNADNNLVVPNSPVPKEEASPTLTTLTPPVCPNGAECPFIHADLREVTPMIVHRNLMYSDVHMCKYRRLVNTAGEAIIAEKEPGLGLHDVEGSTESLRAKAVHDILNAARIDVLAPNGRPPYQSYNLNVLLHTDGAKILFNYLVDPQFEALRLAIRTRHAQLLATNADKGQEPVPPPPTDVLQIRLEERVTPAGEDPVPPPPADVVERGDPAAPYSHCAHFYFNRLCYRGEMCHFVHCVHVDNLLAVEDDGIAVSPAPPSVNSFPSIRTRNGGAGAEAQSGGHRATPNESRRGGGGAAHHHHSAPNPSSKHQFSQHQYVPAGYALGMYPIHSAPTGFVPYQSYTPDSMAIPQYQSPIPMQQHLSQYQPMMYQPQQQIMMPSMMAPMHGMYSNTGMMDPSLHGGAGGTWQFVPQQQQQAPFFTNPMLSGSGSSGAVSNYSPTHQVQFSMPMHQQSQQFLAPQQQQMPYGFLSQPTTTNGAASVNSTPPASVSSWMGGSNGGAGGPQPRSARRSSSQQVASNIMPDPFQPNSAVLVGTSGSWGGSGAEFQVGGPNIMGHQNSQSGTFGGMCSYNAPVASSQSRHSTPHVQGSPQISPSTRNLNSTQGKEPTITIQGRVMSTPTLGGTGSLRNSSTSSIVGQQSPLVGQHHVASSSQGANIVSVGTRNTSDQSQLWAAPTNHHQQQEGAQHVFYPSSAFQQQQQGPPSSSQPHQNLRQ